SQGIGHQKKTISPLPRSLEAKPADAARHADAADERGLVVEVASLAHWEGVEQLIATQMEQAAIADGQGGPCARLLVSATRPADQRGPRALLQLRLGVPGKLAAVELRGPICAGPGQPARPSADVGDEARGQVSRPIAGREALGRAIRQGEPPP